MSVLAARDGYRLWAPSYEAETVVSRLEDEVVRELGISTTGARLLDVGCGTARRLHDTNASLAVGVDVTFEMLSRAIDAHAASLVNGDARALPFASSAFDVVWCRLMIGHLSDCEAACAELSRVCSAGGHVVISDMSADAIAAGHKRAFRDADGLRRELEHYVHDASTLDIAMARHGLVMSSRSVGRIGESVRDLYAAAGRLDLLEQQWGTSLVTATVYRRPVP